MFHLISHVAKEPWLFLEVQCKNLGAEILREGETPHHVSPFPYHISCVFFFVFFLFFSFMVTVIELVCVGSVINGAYPVQFLNVNIFNRKQFLSFTTYAHVRFAAGKGADSERGFIQHVYGLLSTQLPHQVLTNPVFWFVLKTAL